MTLLDKAKTAPPPKKRGAKPEKVTKDELDLVDAYVSGKITLSQVASALDSNFSTTASWIYRKVFQAYQAGLLVRK